ncbi:MAG: very short patch repair endonuclease [Syntrophobacteraceae bacterium]
MDNLTVEHRSWLMSRVRSKDTKPELIVRRMVYTLGFRYRIHCRDLPGKPDLVFRSKHKAIFVHGCFWHMHENCAKARVPRSNSEFWLEKMQKNVQRDKIAKQELQRLGWTFIEVWQCEIGDRENLLKRLSTFLH